MIHYRSASVIGNNTVLSSTLSKQEALRSVKMQWRVEKSPLEGTLKMKTYWLNTRKILFKDPVLFFLYFPL